MTGVNMNYKKYIRENTLRVRATSRGGGIEIDLDTLLGGGQKMTAYQNYLGGGLLGRIENSYNFNKDALEEDMLEILEALTLELNKHLHSLTSPKDGWESATFEQTQTRPVSAY